MRLLIACPKCRRQYDATGRPLGGHFQCRCGESLTIHPPAEAEGADRGAAVVRCSACGGPRHEGSSHCEYCGADFTLREQDRDTVCPKCFFRVSDRAHFCDHCGNPMTGESLAAPQTPLVCPVCKGDHRLVSRTVDGCAWMECPGCAGLWVDNAVFQQLLAHAEATGHAALDRTRDAAARHAAQAAALNATVRHGYVACPICGQLMVHQNFEHRSGVIVDLCRQHGIWFDANKLTQLLDWIRAGGLEEAREERQRKRIIESRMATQVDLSQRVSPIFGSSADLHFPFWFW